MSEFDMQGWTEEEKEQFKREKEHWEERWDEEAQGWREAEKDWKEEQSKLSKKKVFEVVKQEKSKLSALAKSGNYTDYGYALFGAKHRAEMEWRRLDNARNQLLEPYRGQAISRYLDKKHNPERYALNSLIVDAESKLAAYKAKNNILDRILGRYSKQQENEIAQSVDNLNKTLMDLELKISEEHKSMAITIAEGSNGYYPGKYDIQADAHEQALANDPEYRYLSDKLFAAEEVLEEFQGELMTEIDNKLNLELDLNSERPFLEEIELER